MSKKNEGKQKKKDNVPIAKRKLFESVFKGKGKKIESENVSKKRKFEKDVKARKQKKMKKVMRKKRVPLILKRSQWSRVQKLNIYARLDFQYQVMFQNDFVERSMFHETEMRDETHVTFERGECSRQPEPPNEKIAYYFLKFQELIMANNECLNQKLDNLIKEVECLKNIFKDKVTEIVENNENIQKDDNNDGGEGDTNNENVDNEVDRDVTTQQGGQNDLLDDVVYNTALLNEIDKIEKKAIKMKDIEIAIHNEIDFAEPKKEKIELNVQEFEAPRFKLLSQ
ncbi:uncharacterized protein E6C27_scaffold84G00740 [Cucumis melo var. makuwa]|uniref:Protein Ycf2-like n=1 Tax=Cucumis melo var. makuwa TaxID=1194695 RepID=A0A5A7TCI1_CUCMM|nr:uncharacterized protein E6C27_scaffold84G00740 [Cucumis melo var. makuwa]